MARPGQPRIGTQIKVVLTDHQLATLDAMTATGQARTRSDAVRLLLDSAIETSARGTSRQAIDQRLRRIHTEGERKYRTGRVTW